MDVDGDHQNEDLDSDGSPGDEAVGFGDTATIPRLDRRIVPAGRSL